MLDSIHYDSRLDIAPEPALNMQASMSRTLRLVLAELEKVDLVGHYRESLKQSPLTDGEREHFRREYDEVATKLQHHGTTRWNATTLFILMSSAIAGYSLERQPWGLLLAVCVYWLAVVIYFRHKKLTYILRGYHLRLGVLLGHHSPPFIDVWMKSRWTTRFWLLLFGAGYTIFCVVLWNREVQWLW